MLWLKQNRLKLWRTFSYLQSFRLRLLRKLINLVLIYNHVLRLDVEVSFYLSPTGSICSKLSLTYLRWLCTNSKHKLKPSVVSSWRLKTWRATPRSYRKLTPRSKLTNKRSRCIFLKSQDVLLNNLPLLSRLSNKLKIPRSITLWEKLPKKFRQERCRCSNRLLVPLQKKLLKIFLWLKL